MYGLKIMCEFSKVPFEISHKILNPYTTKYAFYEVMRIWWLIISWSYDILSLNEMGPWWSGQNTPEEFQGAVSIRKTVLPGMAIPMLKIRRPNVRLIFNMEIAIRR